MQKKGLEAVGISRFWIGLVLTAVAFANTAGAQPGTKLFGDSGVSPMAVHQGSLGSCYFHASIAALAQAAPGVLRSAISGDSTSGYHVHFFSGPDELVYQEDVEYARTQGFDHSDGRWVTVIMRAYAQRQLRQSMVGAINSSTLIPVFAKPVALAALDQSGPLLVAYDRAIRSVVSQDGTIDKAAFKDQLTTQLGTLGIPAMQAQMLIGFLEQGGFYDALAQTVRDNGEVFGAYRSFGRGGVPKSVLEAFLGKANQGPVAEGNAAVIEKMLIRKHQEGMAMVAGTRTTPPSATIAAVASATAPVRAPLPDEAPAVAKSPDWWVAAHAYTVLDYDQTKGLVTLRNPWGGRPAPDGVFTLPLVAFLQAYQNYAFASSVPE
jgi:hypothetical protein